MAFAHKIRVSGLLKDRLKEGEDIQETITQDEIHKLLDKYDYEDGGVGSIYEELIVIENIDVDEEGNGSMTVSYDINYDYGDRDMNWVDSKQMDIDIELQGDTLILTGE